MPIKGLSTRNDVQPRWPIIGRLHKGGPKRKKGGKEIFGEDLSYFRFTSETEGVEAVFYEVYGKEPNFISCYMPFAEMERCFPSWREDYGQNQMVKVRCDGENWVNWVEGARYHKGSRPCTKPERDSESGCPECSFSYVGRLFIILPPLLRAGHVGLVRMDTHSKNDIGWIASKLVQCEPLAGKEFMLWREENRIGAPIVKDNRRIAVDKWLVKLELSQSYLVKQLEAQEQRAYAMLSSGVGQAEEEDADVGPIPFDEPPLPDDADLEGELVDAAQDLDEAPLPGQEQPQEVPLKPREERPYPAAVIRKKLQGIVANAASEAPATDNQRALVASKLEECFAGQDDADKKRHTVLQYLFEFDSVKDAKFRQGHVTAITTWILLDGNKDDTGDYPLHPKAPAEAAGIIRAFQEAAGQEALF